MLGASFLAVAFLAAVSRASFIQDIELDAKKAENDLKHGVEIAETLIERSTMAVSSGTLNSYTDFTHFAAAAYCAPTIDWNCGGPCSDETFTVTVAGGDGNDVQYYYVGYSQKLDTVIVAHEGTDPTQLMSDLTDIDILTTQLSSTLFPGISSDVWVHQGFADEQAQTASIILSAVQSTLASTGTNSVTLVGHSLGAAITLLDTLMLSANLPSVSLQTITYGLPRVGNPAFASLIDSIVPGSQLVRIVHASDPVPILPGQLFGFQHPHGELHILSTLLNDAVACSGDDDNSDADCIDQWLDNDILFGNVLDHLGPYPGNVYIGTPYCG